MKCLVISVAVLVILCSCGEESEPVSCEGSNLALTLADVTPASACGSNDGGLTVSASGGTPPYTYTIDSQSQSSGAFTQLSPGAYTVSVKDHNGCQTELINVALEAVDLAFSHTVIEDTDCTIGNGSVNISILQGEGPFLYRLNDGAFQEESSFENLRAGQYEVTLRAGQCSNRFNLTIPKGNTGTSWIAEVRPLIETKCALSGCHNGVTRPDLRVYETAKKYATQIKKLTADRSMPFTGSLTQQQIDMLACWVDEGANQN